MEKPDQNPTVKNSPPGNPETEKEKYIYLLGLLQNTRVEAQNLWSLFGELEKDVLAYESTRPVAEIVAPYQAIYDNNKTVIDNHISSMTSVIAIDGRLNQWMGDDIKIIENKWERFNRFYPDFKNGKNDAILIGIRKCSGFLSDIVYQCSFKSIPERLKQHLLTVSNGQALDFYETFEDEVSSKDQATKILQYIANHPKALYYKSDKPDKPAYQLGIADSAKGLVYRIGSNSEKMRSLGKIILWCIAALVGSYIVLILYSRSVSSSTLSGVLPLGQIAILFVVMLGGAAAHIAIDMLKESRTAKPEQLLAINDLVLWIHIKEAVMKSGILILFLGFLILMVTVPSINAETMFVAGYSVDSLGDLFIARFESVMDTKGKALKS